MIQEFDKTKFKLAIFDYDGTVLNSMPMWETMMSTFLHSKGVLDTMDVDLKIQKMTTTEAIAFVRDSFLQNEDIVELEASFKEYVGKEYVKQLLIPDAVKLINELKEAGVRCVLLSATDKSLLKASLSAQHYESLFDEVYSASNLGMSKATGEPFSYVANKEGYKKKDTIIFEDAFHAILGAKMQGFKVVAIDEATAYDHLDEIKELANYYMVFNKENKSI